MPKLILAWSRPPVPPTPPKPATVVPFPCTCRTRRACRLLGCERELAARVLALLAGELVERMKLELPPPTPSQVVALDHAVEQAGANPAVFIAHLMTRLSTDPESMSAAASFSLFQDMATRFKGELAAGRSFGGEIVVGDLVATMSVRVRRRVHQADAVAYRTGALAQLQLHLHLARHCGCRVMPRGAFRHESDCEGKITAVVVYTSPHARIDAPAPSYLFVCGRHREVHRVDPRHVLAIVDLPEADLVLLRARAKAEYDRRTAEFDAECEQRRAAGGR